MSSAIADSTELGIDTPRRLCPRDSFFVVAVGIAGLAAADKRIVRVGEACRGINACWVVRVQRAHLTRVGANLVVYNFFLEESGTNWRVITAVPLAWAE
jgi:hypothetical protein